MRSLLLTVSLTIALLGFWPSAPAPAARVAGLGAPQRPTVWVAAPLPAQEGEQPGGGEMGHEPWPGRNWGLVGAGLYSAVAVASIAVLVGVIFSWPHRRQ